MPRLDPQGTYALRPTAAAALLGAATALAVATASAAPTNPSAAALGGALLAALVATLAIHLGNMIAAAIAIMVAALMSQTGNPALDPLGAVATFAAIILGGAELFDVGHRLWHGDRGDD